MNTRVDQKVDGVKLRPFPWLGNAWRGFLDCLGAHDEVPRMALHQVICYHRAYIHRYLFPLNHRLTWVWTLFWVYLGPKGTRTQYLWWWISFWKWPISFRAARLTTQLTLCSYTSRRWWGYMVSRGPLFLIKTPSSLFTFGSHYGRKWVQNSVTVPLVIPRLTDTRKLLIGL